MKITYCICFSTAGEILKYTNPQLSLLRSQRVWIMFRNGRY